MCPEVGDSSFFRNVDNKETVWFNNSKDHSLSYTAIGHITKVTLGRLRINARLSRPANTLTFLIFHILSVFITDGKYGDENIFELFFQHSIILS
jgi:hypothetical protein